MLVNRGIRVYISFIMWWSVLLFEETGEGGSGDAQNSILWNSI
jgi:hypothetical protein